MNNDKVNISEEIEDLEEMINLTKKLIPAFPDDKLLLLNLEQLIQRKELLECKQKVLAK